MNKLLATAAFLLLSACVEEGPPNYNERDRRAYNSLQETNRYDRDDNYYHDHQYDRHDWHDDRVNDEPDYNPHDGHDHWARQSN